MIRVQIELVAKVGLGASLDSYPHWAADFPEVLLWVTFPIGVSYPNHSTHLLLPTHKVTLYTSGLSIFLMKT